MAEYVFHPSPTLVSLPVTEFAEQVRPVLAADPVRCSVIATLLARYRSHPRSEDTWIVILDGPDPVGAALAGQERKVFITPLPPALSRSATASLARLLYGRRTELRCVSAQNADTANFARAWSDVSGATPGPEHVQGLYAIAEPPEIRNNVSGSTRTAKDADVPGLGIWMAEFLTRFPDDRNLGSPEDVVRLRMRNGHTFVWEAHGQLVSMAHVSKPAAGVSWVGAVYTPPRFRGHGYASAVTATASRQGFAAGASAVMLYTDLSDPTPNLIYQALGYHRVGHASVINFG